MRLADRTVLVTSAGFGIGEATARRCADEGATVVVTDVDEASGSSGGIGAGTAGNWVDSVPRVVAIAIAAVQLLFKF